MCSVSLNVECVINPLFFDMKLKDERSSIADNDSGSPLIYRVFLPTFVQLPTEMPFRASPVPQIEAAKIFFLLHGHCTEAIERGYHLRLLVLESQLRTLQKESSYGKIKLQ